jgi:RimJ/RimL family protein N-acetyltransferase
LAFAELERGYRRLVTSTHETNEPMRRLDEKLGYRRCLR